MMENTIACSFRIGQEKYVTNISIRERVYELIKLQALREGACRKRDLNYKVAPSVGCFGS